MRLNPEKFDASLPNSEIALHELDPLIGHLSIEFNGLEFSICLLYQPLLGASLSVSQAVWSSLMWKGRIDLVTSLIGTHFSQQHVIAEFWRRRLHPFLEEIATERNKIVHGMRLIMGDIQGNTANFIMHNSFGDVGYSRKRYRIDEAELREIILDTRAAHQAVNLFHGFLIGTEEPLRRLEDLSVRRRPPRAQRKRL